MNASNLKALWVLISVANVAMDLKFVVNFGIVRNFVFLCFLVLVLKNFPSSNLLLNSFTIHQNFNRNAPLSL